MSWTAESDLEDWMLGELEGLGFRVMSGADMSPERCDAPRGSFREVILGEVFAQAVRDLNPDLPDGAIGEVVARVRDTVFATDLIAENRRLHELLVNGVPVSYEAEGEERSARARLVDWEDRLNDWRAINQMDIAGRAPRRPDVLLFLNGLPIVVMELKGLEGEDIAAAYRQLESCKADVPEAFRPNLVSVISDGLTARYGSLSADLDRFMRWRTVDGETIVRESDALALETLTRGLLSRRTLLDLMRWFVVFEDEGRGPIKKVAGYHQFHAVRKAIDSVLEARRGDGKGGVIWHTQGSGKSLLMTFLAGRAMRHPDLANPTVVVLTDRNDLDNQLFATFGRCADLLGETPVQADSVEDLKRQLSRQVGGIVFSTIQKFRPEQGSNFPELTDRSNVVVLVDEAHRTQYGFDARIDRTTGEMRHGLAWQLRKALPNAVYVAFTGTPIELVGANTRSVFGDYIDVYDITRAVEDGATVPIYYEGRVAKIDLDKRELGDLDAEFDEATEGLEDAEAGEIAKRWSRVEALVGAEKRLDAVVADILEHFDARVEAIDGKAMIVGMSRRICAEIYERIVAARPDWHSDSDDAGAVKVVITGNATDPEEIRKHTRSKGRQEALRNRFKDPDDPLKLVIVRDMWLTGFDAPCMHTLYVDKPMQGHGLMQAIARVNRVFRDKPAGLVVDYIGLAADLKKALANYSEPDQARTGIDERKAVATFLDALDVVRQHFHGFDYSQALEGSKADRLRIMPRAVEHVLEAARVEHTAREAEGEDAEKGLTRRFSDNMAALVKAFKLASGSEEAAAHSQEVAFFVAVRSGIEKLEGTRTSRSRDAADFAIQQMINRSVASTEVVDILEACGLERPDIGVLSEEFLADIRNMEQKNLAVEALKKLLNGEIQSRTRTNITRQEEFSKRLSEAVARYHNRSVDAIQVIQELIAIAQQLREEPDDTLSNEERAFYDALAKNESAAEVMSNEELRVIATELVNTVRSTAGVDWWRRENVRSKMRLAVKKILRQHGYPPDMETEAIQRVIRQAEALAGA